LRRPSYEPSYRRALEAFVELINGGQPRLATLNDGLRSLEIIHAAEKSARDQPELAATSVRG
jgi:predicted dehydrogenase